MPDVFTRAKRSNVMSLIRSSGNRDTELLLAEILRQHDITGWRRNFRVFGKPDFVFCKKRLTLFVDGCFWHCCPLHSTSPRTNAKFWRKKLERNQQRDRLVNRTLRKMGWRVLRIWEHELTKKNLPRCLKRIQRVLSQ